MNERMLELYRQAQVPHTAIDPSNNMSYETTTFSAEKFSELIVRECIGVIGEENYTMLTGKAYCTELKRHFGVK